MWLIAAVAGVCRWGMNWFHSSSMRTSLLSAGGKRQPGISSVPGVLGAGRSGRGPKGSKEGPHEESTCRSPSARDDLLGEGQCDARHRLGGGPAGTHPNTLKCLSHVGRVVQLPGSEPVLFGMKISAILAWTAELAGTVSSPSDWRIIRQAPHRPELSRRPGQPHGCV